ncbi:MAG: hypothetical protein WCT05_12105, partial [Lentisphaeria bacterium]
LWCSPEGVRSILRRPPRGGSGAGSSGHIPGASCADRQGEDPELEAPATFPEHHAPDDIVELALNNVIGNSAFVRDL